MQLRVVLWWWCYGGGAMVVLWWFYGGSMVVLWWRQCPKRPHFLLSFLFNSPALIMGGLFDLLCNT